MRMILKHKHRRMRFARRVPVLLALFALLLQGCEDDPILEPTGDDSGGGSYGKMAPLASPSAGVQPASNPETF